MTSTSVRFAFIQRAIAENRALAGEQEYSDPETLSRVSTAAPFVVSVAEGSSAALHLEEALPEASPGDERLAEPVDDVSTGSALELLTSELDLTPVESSEDRSLSNSKKDALHVDLERAIDFWLTYDGGVEISKVSPLHANARGFYNISKLKEICRGVGIPFKTKVEKADLAASVRSFYNSNEKMIEEERERRRETGDNIEDMIGDGALPSSEQVEPVASSSGMM